MDSILESIRRADEAKCKDFLLKLFSEYLRPAFGSMPKRDLDILLFSSLQDLGVLEKNPDIFDLVSQLKVSRTKARNLLYESKLRRSTVEELQVELAQLLCAPLLEKDGDKMVLNVENPLLIDHIKSQLKHLGFFSDGSFSPEVVKLSSEAFTALFVSIFPPEALPNLEEILVEQGFKSDTSAKGIAGGMLKALIKQIASENGVEASQKLNQFLHSALSENWKLCKSLLS